MKKSITDNFLPIPAHYGVFPYIVVRIFSATFVQIPVILCNIEFNNYVQNNRAHLPNLAFVGLKNNKIKLNRKDFLAKADTQKKLVEYLKGIASENNYSRCCLVLAEDKAVYYENGKTFEATSLPSGGVVYSKDLCPLKFDWNHYRDDQPEYIDLTGSVFIP